MSNDTIFVLILLVVTLLAVASVKAPLIAMIAGATITLGLFALLVFLKS